MTTLSTETRDLLSALTWYMTARKTALRAAILFRTPLSTIAMTDMRVQYSAYFQNLLSATELMRESAPLLPTFFETELYERFIFPEFQDGKSNYEYIKQLRHSIVHRGYDITSSMHFAGDFPMLVAEPSFKNNAKTPAKTKTFQTFDKYVLGIITKCESVISDVILNTLNKAGIFHATIDLQAAIAEDRSAVQYSHVMPDWAKAMAAAVELKPEWFVAINTSMKDSLREALAPCEILDL